MFNAFQSSICMQKICKYVALNLNPLLTSWTHLSVYRPLRRICSKFLNSVFLFVFMYTVNIFNNMCGHYFCPESWPKTRLLRRCNRNLMSCRLVKPSSQNNRRLCYSVTQVSNHFFLHALRFLFHWDKCIELENLFARVCNLQIRTNPFHVDLICTMNNNTNCMYP